ncbi:MAG: hypothetical protein V4502_00670 [Pseudomonadota bacterium]
MDSYREYPSDFDLPASDPPPQSDVAAQIGTDERRMHVRAYNYWVSLLEGRDFPSIEDLEPADLKDFAPNSVLLDFTCGGDNPALPYVGAAIREECALDDDMRTIADVPSRSLLSRLTDHYLQIIANRAPVGFEAEFDNPRGESICYRGILMPFSSDGDTIDFIYGVINWKRLAANDIEQSLTAALLPIVEEELAELPSEAELEVEVEHLPIVEEVVTAAAETVVEDEPFTQPEPLAAVWEDDPVADPIEEIPALVPGDDAGLADRLWAARETAESVKAGEGRTRAALYHALSLAYDFAVAADENPEEYAELLEESGVKSQARAPMTPIVKLVFGIDYDKARLTEFAAALSYAQRQQVTLGAFQHFIEAQPGGLKALVAGERQARRPDSQPDTKGAAARAHLRSAPSISLADVPAEDEFAVIVTRRGADGRHEPVAIVDDQALVERAIRRAV